ncbi:MAG: hypothetical protein CMN28_11730 [Salinisphaeraceae bacterium]|nr:hypothetical protein [Salinisphaeraceae bacterium]
MILRALILLAVVGLAWYVWQRMARPAAGRADPGKRPESFERMVECRHCGVHVPADQAVTDSRSRSYCCAAHVDRD